MALSDALINDVSSILSNNWNVRDGQALLLFTINVGGLILGPWLVGVLNDILGLKMVGYSLGITVGLGSLVSCTMFRVTYEPYRKHCAMMHEGG